MFEKISTGIAGCYEIVFRRLPDNRGWFTKTFHSAMYRELGIDFSIEEEYFSLSTTGVFRGMHFQVPPHAIDKLIMCHHGSIRDFVADLRKDSLTYGQWRSFELAADVPKALLVPKGLAHGFYVTGESALVQCKSSGVFEGSSDKAISYRSFGFADHIINPVLSEKDMTAPLLKDFTNPF